MTSTSAYSSPFSLFQVKRVIEFGWPDRVSGDSNAKPPSIKYEPSAILLEGIAHQPSMVKNVSEKKGSVDTKVSRNPLLTSTIDQMNKL